MSALQQETFPVAFAETKDHCQQINDSTVFYVEWLDNSSEFPGLATPTNTNLTGGNWELLQRKEIVEDNEQENHTIEPVEDSWSKIISAEDHPLYADMVEKNAAELQPTKRIIKPLWSNDQIKRKSQEDITEKNNDDDLYEEDLGAELFDDLKSQSRRSNQLSRRRQLHTLKVTDYHVQGILRVATTTKGWIHPPITPEGISQGYTFQLLVREAGIVTEAQAKRYNSRHSHNHRRYTWDYYNSNNKFRSVNDYSEFSVFSPCTKRY
jgi:hypothetical protein